MTLTLLTDISCRKFPGFSDFIVLDIKIIVDVILIQKKVTNGNKNKPIKGDKFE